MLDPLPPPPHPDLDSTPLARGKTGVQPVCTKFSAWNSCFPILTETPNMTDGGQGQGGPLSTIGLRSGAGSD